MGIIAASLSRKKKISSAVSAVLCHSEFRRRQSLFNRHPAETTCNQQGQGERDGGGSQHSTALALPVKPSDDDGRPFTFHEDSFA